MDSTDTLMVPLPWCLYFVHPWMVRVSMDFVDTLTEGSQALPWWSYFVHPWMVRVSMDSVDTLTKGSLFRLFSMGNVCSTLFYDVLFRHK